MFYVIVYAYHTTRIGYCNNAYIQYIIVPFVDGYDLIQVII